VTWTLHASHRTFLADVGVFHVLASGPLHGNWLETPLAPGAEGNYFGIHFSPALLLITPFYLLNGSAMVYLTALNVGLVLGGLFFMQAAVVLLRQTWLAALFGIFYFTDHFILSMQLALHPESLAMAGIMAAFLGVVRGSTRWFFGGLIAALLVKEDFALFLAIFSAALATEAPLRRMALRGLALCIVWGIASAVIMWLCGYAEYAALGMTPASRFGTMEDGLLPFLWRAIVRVATNPTPLVLLLSVTPLCFRDPRLTAVGLIGALPFLLTADPLISRLWYYYSYGSIPFLLMASVRGAVGLRLPAWVLPAILGAVSIVSFLQPTRTDDLRHRLRPILPRHEFFREFKQQIPPDAAVAAQYDLHPQISARRTLLPIREWSLDRIEYLVTDAHGRSLPLAPEEREAVLRRINSDEFEVVLELEGFSLLRRNPVPHERK
jgi:uncharacterized membrane protein